MVNNIQNSYTNIVNMRAKNEEILNDDRANEFREILDSAKELIKSNNEAEKEVAVRTTDFILGKNDNLHGLMIAQEKSSILLQYTMQVRNNALDAYKEIMRIPV